MLHIPTEPMGSIPEEVCDRETAFAKIRARVMGTALASERLQAN